MNEKPDWAGMFSEWLLVSAGLTSSAALSGTRAGGGGGLNELGVCKGFVASTGEDEYEGSNGGGGLEESGDAGFGSSGGGAGLECSVYGADLADSAGAVVSCVGDAGDEGALLECETAAAGVGSESSGGGGGTDEFVEAGSVVRAAWPGRIAFRVFFLGPVSTDGSTSPVDGAARSA